MKVLTDNWLIQNASELLTGQLDVGDLASWMVLTADRVQVEHSTAGAVQVVSLLSLLEHIVLAENLIVMADHVGTWAAAPGFSELRDRGMVETFSRGEHATFEEHRAAVIEDLRGDPRIQAADDRGLDLVKRNQPSLEMQVIRAAATHVVRAVELEVPYAPHPARARFLRSTVLSARFRSRANAKLDEIVQEGRARVLRSVDPDGHRELVNLDIELPPIGLLCLGDSGLATSPISVALQLRDDPSVSELRGHLSAMEAALRDVPDVSRYQRLAAQLDAAAKEAQRQMGIRAGEPDGPTQISAWGLPLRLPAALQRPVPLPRFTGLLRRFIAPTPRVTELLATRLKVLDPRVLEDLRNPELW